jgi:hypothetical protein
MTIDHGRTLAHDVHGRPLHYVHEISIPRPSMPPRPKWRPPEGYRYSYGYRDQDGNPRDVYYRCEPA